MALELDRFGMESWFCHLLGDPGQSHNVSESLFSFIISILKNWCEDSRFYLKYLAQYLVHGKCPINSSHNFIFLITCLQEEAGQELVTIRGGGQSNFKKKKTTHKFGELEKERQWLLVGNSSQNSTVIQSGPAKSAGTAVAKASWGSISLNLCKVPTVRTQHKLSCLYKSIVL